MKTLVMIPIQQEYRLFLESCAKDAFRAENARIGNLPIVHFPELDITVSLGGLGKVQFAIQTQHLLDSEPGWELVICAGAAGCLAKNLSVGDIVVATETVEHDIKNKFGKPRVPRYKGDEATIYMLRNIAPIIGTFRLHFGPIASGDEDVIEVQRQEELKELTGAIAVAWEGAGGARACQFSDIPFVEMRGISDGADSEAPSDFEKNLPIVMENLVILISSLVKQFNT
jgi:adenosylhomocysteine nucleosidase